MIEILLSTYNGERYLAEQLESLLQQSYKDIRISIRDDGSTDKTVPIIRDFIARYPGKIALDVGKNLGYAKSFLTLLERSGHAEYYAFCDQDDVWYEDKIQRAVDALLPHRSEPALYASGYEEVSSSLEHLGQSSAPSEISFRTSLVECRTFGCTMVMNRAARDLIYVNKPSEVGLTHDWWSCLVISALGKVIYDPRPSLKYRQHDSNLSGAHPSSIKRWMNRLKRLKRKGQLTPWPQQAIALSNIYENKLSAENVATLRLIEKAQSSLFARARLATSNRIRRENLLDGIVFRFLILIGAFN